VTTPRRITGEPPGWEGTRALHQRLYSNPADADKGEADLAATHNVIRRLLDGWKPRPEVYLWVRRVYAGLVRELVEDEEPMTDAEAEALRAATADAIPETPS